MHHTHGAKKSNLIVQIFNRYDVTLLEFAQIIDGLFAQVLTVLVHTDPKLTQIKVTFFLLMCTRPSLV